VRSRRVKWAAVVAALVVGAGALAGCTDPRDLGAGVRSEAVDVNAAGVIVGNRTDAAGTTQAFRSVLGHGLQPLDGEHTATTQSRADASNDVGQVVGERDGVAVVWAPDGTRTPLPPPEGTTTEGRWNPTDINDDGFVVGYYGRARRVGPVVWNPHTNVTTDLYTAVGLANGINDRGQIVGYTFPKQGGDATALLWNPDGAGGWSPAEALPAPDGYTGGRAWRINDAGTISGEVLGAAGSASVLWRGSDHAVTVIPAVPGSVLEPQGLNGHDVVVGRLRGGVAPYETVAFRWAPGDAAVTRLPGLGGPDSAASAVNDAGVIVGSSTAVGSTDTRAVSWAADRDGAAPPRPLPGPT
jgi:uncharacterized membrane protein